MSAPDTPQPTKRAAAFMAANRDRPCIIGVARPDGGAVYTLADANTLGNRAVYELTAADCKSMPSMPRWLHG